MIFVWVTIAHGEEAAPTAARTFLPHPVAGHEIFEMRGGVAATSGGSGGTICAEATPHRYVSIEACGNGGGFLYPEAGDDLMHVRAEGNVPLLRTGRAGLTLQAGVGFAELQRGEDAPGFRFGAADSPDQRDGAGADGSLSLKARLWATPGVYTSFELNGGAAWIPAAPVILGRGGPLVPYTQATVGLGF